MTKELSDRQVAFDITDWELPSKAFETGAPKRNKETSTYIDDSGETLNGYLLAYVPEDVWEDLDSLYGKELKVIFGEENRVALIAVTNDDVIDNEYITKYVAEDKEVTIGGQKYKLADTAAATKTTVNNVTVSGGFEVALAKVLKVAVEDLTTKKFDKKIEANVILNSKGKVTEINMYVSGDYADFYTNEFIVGRIRNEKVQDHKLTTIYDWKEIDEEDLPKVYIDGVKSSIDEIEVGDVLTVYYKDKNRKADEVVTIYASRETVEGEVTDITSKNKLDIDGKEYTMSEATALLVTDEIKDESTEAKSDFTYYYEETVTLHLNIYGEYVALIAEENIADYTFGVVDYYYDAKEDENGVYTQQLRIFLDGARNSNYKLVYDAEANDADIDALADDADGALRGNNTLHAELTTAMTGDNNALVAFKADANNEIELDDIIVIAYDDAGVLADTDYEIIQVTTANTIDYDNKRITISGRRYDATNAEIVKSEGGDKKPESITWKKLVNQSTEKLAVSGLVICEKGKYEILYVYTQDSAEGGTDVTYAVVNALGQVKKINGKTYKNVLTLLTEDNEEIFVDANEKLDVNADEKVIASYKESGDKLTEYATLLDVEILNSVEDTEALRGIFNNSLIVVATNGTHVAATVNCDCGNVVAPADEATACTGYTAGTHVPATAACACGNVEAPADQSSCTSGSHVPATAACACGNVVAPADEATACTGHTAGTHVAATPACACGNVETPDDEATACTGYTAGTGLTKAALRITKVDGEYLVYTDDEDKILPEIKVCDKNDVVVFDATGDEIVVSNFNSIEAGDLVVPFMFDGEATLLVIIAE